MLGSLTIKLNTRTEQSIDNGGYFNFYCQKQPQNGTIAGSYHGKKHSFSFFRY